MEFNKNDIALKKLHCQIWVKFMGCHNGWERWDRIGFLWIVRSFGVQHLHDCQKLAKNDIGVAQNKIREIKANTNRLRGSRFCKLSYRRILRKHFSAAEKQRDRIEYVHPSKQCGSFEYWVSSRDIRPPAFELNYN